MTDQRFPDSDQRDRERLAAIRAMLGVIAGPSARCRDCSREIWWLTTKNGRKAPYTEEAKGHFADCPAATERRQR